VEQEIASLLSRSSFIQIATLRQQKKQLEEDAMDASNRESAADVTDISVSSTGTAARIKRNIADKGGIRFHSKERWSSNVPCVQGNL
jgi:hypothetical protein